MTPGAPAPSFSLPDQDGKTHHLADYAGRHLILYFYPRASTPGCTCEAQEFRDLYPQFQRRGLILLGASPDTVRAQKKFADAQRIPFPLLADADRTLAQAYGVLKEKNMYGRRVLGVERTTFLIAPDGCIERVWPQVKPAGHAAALLAELGE